MFKKIILSLFTLLIIFSMLTTNLNAQNSSSSVGNNQQKKQSPFLITGELPHITKLLIKQWKSPELQLNDEQKTLLLVVRKDTILGINKIAPKINSLQKEVKDGIFNGKTPDELHPIVQEVAKLKAKVTMIHLKCLFDTKKILNEQQLNFLLK